MRILFVAPRFHTNQYQVVKTLIDNGHEVIFNVAFIGPTEDHSLIIPTNFKQSRLSSLLEKILGRKGVKRPYYFPEFFNYWKYLKNLKPEMLVIRDPYKYFSILATVYAFLLRIKIVFYTQEELNRDRSVITYLKQQLTIALFRAAWMTPIIGNEKYIAKTPNYMYFVPLPIPSKDYYSFEKKPLSKIPKILMVGKYHQNRKKHLLFIDAINKLKDKYLFKVTIVGECATVDQIKKYNLIRNRIRSLKLEGIIELKKNIPFQEMEDTYLSHDVFVLPAINEQYGISTTEALAYGLPVICTDTCGARFNIISGVNGYIVKSSDLMELTYAIESIISDKEKMYRMGEKARKYVKEQLSGEAFYKNFSFMVEERFNTNMLETQKV